LGAEVGGLAFEEQVDQTLEALADHIEAHLDVELIWSLAAEIDLPPR
jgi:adenosylcobyric acid synthase